MQARTTAASCSQNRLLAGGWVAQPTSTPANEITTASFFILLSQSPRNYTARLINHTPYDTALPAPDIYGVKIRINRI